MLAVIVINVRRHSHWNFGEGHSKSFTKISNLSFQGPTSESVVCSRLKIDLNSPLTSPNIFAKLEAVDIYNTDTLSSSNLRWKVTRKKIPLSLPQLSQPIGPIQFVERGLGGWSTEEQALVLGYCYHNGVTNNSELSHCDDTRRHRESGQGIQAYTYFVSLNFSRKSRPVLRDHGSQI